MISLIQAQMYKLKKFKMFYLCLIMNVIIVAAIILVRVKIGNITSAKNYLELMYRNYSFTLPLLCFTVSFASREFSQKAICTVVGRGISVSEFYVSQAIVSCIVVVIYCTVGAGIGVFICHSFYPTEFNALIYIQIVKMFLVEVIIHCAYVIFVLSLSYIIRNGKVSMFTNFALLIFLPVILNGIVQAMQLQINLRNIWISNVVNIIGIGISDVWYAFAVLISIFYIVVGGIISILISNVREID